MKKLFKKAVCLLLVLIMLVGIMPQLDLQQLKAVAASSYAFVKEPVTVSNATGTYGRYDVPWEVNFTPVRMELFGNDVLQSSKTTGLSKSGTYSCEIGDRKYIIRAYYGSGENDFVASNPFYINSSRKFLLQPQSITTPSEATVSWDVNFDPTKICIVDSTGAIQSTLSGTATTKKMGFGKTDYKIRAYYGSGDMEYIESDAFSVTSGLPQRINSVVIYLNNPYPQVGKEIYYRSLHEINGSRDDEDLALVDQNSVEFIFRHSSTKNGTKTATNSPYYKIGYYDVVTNITSNGGAKFAEDCTFTVKSYNSTKGGYFVVCTGTLQSLSEYDTKASFVADLGSTGIIKSVTVEADYACPAVGEAPYGVTLYAVNGDTSESALKMIDASNIEYEWYYNNEHTENGDDYTYFSKSAFEIDNSYDLWINVKPAGDHRFEQGATISLKTPAGTTTGQLYGYHDFELSFDFFYNLIRPRIEEVTFSVPSNVPTPNGAVYTPVLESVNGSNELTHLIDLDNSSIGWYYSETESDKTSDYLNSYNAQTFNPEYAYNLYMRLAADESALFADTVTIKLESPSGTEDYVTYVTSEPYSTATKQILLGKPKYEIYSMEFDASGKYISVGNELFYPTLKSVNGSEELVSLIGENYSSYWEESTKGGSNMDDYSLCRSGVFEAGKAYNLQLSASGDADIRFTPDCEIKVNAGDMAFNTSPYYISAAQNEMSANVFFPDILVHDIKSITFSVDTYFPRVGGTLYYPTLTAVNGDESLVSLVDSEMTGGTWFYADRETYDFNNYYFYDEVAFAENFYYDLHFVMESGPLARFAPRCEVRLETPRATMINTVNSTLFSENAKCDFMFARPKAPITITAEPQDVCVEDGKTAKVTIEAEGEGLTYEWYYLNPGDETFTCIPASTDKTYSVTMNKELSGQYVYCIVFDKYGHSLTSDIAILTMKTPIAITTQPQSVCVAKGKTAKVTVAAEGEELTYQWYYKNASSSDFLLTTTYTTNEYSVPMNESRDGRQVYCVITDKYGNSVTTDTVTLSMQTPLEITAQPQNVSAASGKVAKTFVTATGDELTYKWYFKNKTASGFALTNTYTTNEYYLTMNESRDGRQIYCVITDKYGNSVTTDTVTLSMAAGTPLAITAQPQNVTVESGEIAKTTVTATGEGLIYKWYYKNKNASDFAYTTSFSSNYYSVEMNESRSGRQIYCVITDKYGNSVTTDTVTISMAAGITPLSITSQPQDVSAIEGATAKTTVIATGDALTYKWYYKNKNASDFAYTSSFSSNYYSVAMNESRDGRQIYCVITDKYGNSVTTDTVTITMAAAGTPLVITSQPVSVAVEVGAVAKASVSAEGEGTLTYTWYVRDPGKSDFVKSSITKSVYAFTMSEAKSGREIYCVVKDGNGNTVKSNTVTMSAAAVETPLKITAQPKNTTAAVGALAKVTITAEGEGTLTYTWYVRDPGNSDFTKSSIAKSTYGFTMSEAKSGREVYCIVTDGNGNTVKSNTVTMSAS